MKLVITLIVLVLLSGGCMSSQMNNKGQMQIYTFPSLEPAWIRNGEPIIFDGKEYFAVNDDEVMEDSEVLPVGQYKGISLFVEKIDTKPYPRLYTKFGQNKFRYWEPHHD